MTADRPATRDAEPRFHHLDPSVDEDAWLAGAAIGAALTSALPPAGTRMVVLAAHGDDETLGVGGLIADARRLGHAVDVVVASDGSASHPHSPSHPPELLASRRHAEVVAAMARLGNGIRLHQLALPDGRLGDSIDAIAAAVEELLYDTTDEIWLLTTWSGDGHPDHHACADAAARVSARHRDRVRLWSYPVWWWHWGEPDQALDATAVVLPVSTEAIQRREAALACYVSQVEPLSESPGDEAVLTDAMLAHSRRDFEFLIDDQPRPAAAGAYFDRLYDADDDPWRLESGWYEERKRALLLASLPHRRYRRVFEPGCSTGVLTEGLLSISDAVTATDASEAALARAAARLTDRSGLDLQLGWIPRDWPDGTFDLIVLSETGYYVTDLALLARRITESLAPDGVLVLCHWRHHAADHPLTAETVHATLGRLTGLTSVVRHREADFLLEVSSRDGRSVATAEGVSGSQPLQR